MKHTDSLVYLNLSCGAATANVVSANAGLTGYHIFNPGANASFIQLFDAAANGDVSLGTTVPKISLGIPANGGATRPLSFPVRFSKGIVIACSNTANGSGAPASNNIVNLEYTR